jgi:hypothetical protein
MVLKTYPTTGEQIMTMDVGTAKTPIWLQIEEQILKLDSGDLSGDNLENAVQSIAGELDGTGLNISRNAGNMLLLRSALDARVAVGHSLLEDFNAAVGALTLDDVIDTNAATSRVIKQVGESWPRLTESARKPDVLNIVERTRLDLLIAKAKTISEEEGIRLLIEEDVASGVIIEALEITEESFNTVNAAVEAERAERVRVQRLIDEAQDKPDDEKIKDLINHDVADELIIELGGYEAGMVDGVRKAMEEELKEKQRLAEEEAARKAAEAAGPPVEDIPDDELLEYIESIREIMEFSDKEDEIRTMCEQSSIPKSLVDVAVSDPDKLDELEKNAEG